MALDPVVGFVQIEQAVANHALQANNAMADLAQAAAGYLAKSVAAGGTISLSADESQYAVIDLTGAPGSNVTVVQHADAPKVTLYRNLTTGGRAVEVKLGAGGTAFRIPACQSLYLLSSAQSLDPDTKAKHDGNYFFDDFAGTVYQTNYVLQLANSDDNTNQVPTTDTATVTCTFRVPRSGKLAGIAVVGADTLAASDTDYVTFSAVNKLRSGAGAVALLSGSDANTTKATGGSAWTAYVSRTLTLTATDADLVVTAIDVIEVKITVTGTLANVVNRPTVRLLFQEIPLSLSTRPTVAAGDTPPYVVPVLNSQLGEVLLRPQSVITSTQEARADWGAQAFYNASKGLRFRARVKVSGVSTNQDFVWGLQGSAGTTPHDNVTHHVWLRVEAASFALLWESDDGSSDDDDNTTGVTLTADLYAEYEIDMTVLAAVLIKHNGIVVGTADMSALPANTSLMPVFAISKASGAQVDGLTVDWYEVSTQSR